MSAVIVLPLILALVSLMGWWMLLRTVRHLVDRGDAAELDKFADVVRSYWRRR